MRRFSSSNRSALEAAVAPGPAPFPRSICKRVVERDHEGASATETGGESMVVDLTETQTGEGDGDQQGYDGDSACACALQLRDAATV